MIVLGFDTATASTSVALRLDGGSVSEARDDPRAGEHPGHATRLLEMAHELLRAQGISWSELDRIAVGVGPGTFTGLRVGVATARGLAQSLGAQLVGVSSPMALAAGVFGEAAAEPHERPDVVVAVIDARRGEVFAAVYERSDGPTPSELIGPRALAPEDLASLLSQAGFKDDSPTRRWLAVGDGVIRFRVELQRAEIPMPADSAPLHLLSAVAICELGAHAPAVNTIEEIVPDYRRRPDAELALEAAAQGRAPEP
jgi:tRNA threonylcarbamoyladenosine biosynthesis protein TsaB